MPNTKLSRGACWHSLAACLAATIALAVVGCGDDDDDDDSALSMGRADGSVARDGGPVRDVDGGPVRGDVDAGLCQQKLATFQAFLTAHSSCAVDSDCAIVGDCCPHADFPVVQSAVSAEARSLQLGLCGFGACDGPTYSAVCTEGTCARMQRPPQSWCGAAPPPRADGGTSDGGP